MNTIINPSRPRDWQSHDMYIILHACNNTRKKLLWRTIYKDVEVNISSFARSTVSRWVVCLKSEIFMSWFDAVECQTPSVTTVGPTPTKSSSSMKPTVHPSPTPLPPGVSHYTYVLNDVTNGSLPCLRMQVDVALNFTFVNTSDFTVGC